ncbi:MAG: ATP-binding protein [Planctomycetota bacterium]
MSRTPILFTWSSGKDSAMGLHILQQDPHCEVLALLTTINRDHGRVSMHGVREALVERQAAAIGLPLEKILIGRNATNADCEAAVETILSRYRARGVYDVAYGDLYLEDVRKYRENNLARAGMRALFPLWKRDTRELARHFVSAGFRATVTCVDTQALDGRFCGRDLDVAFFAELPAKVDPCGENGEYHSFCWAGPCFREPVTFTRGETVLRDGRFMFTDLIPAGE